MLFAVTTTSREEVLWITEGVTRYFPDLHEAFRAATPEARAEEGGLVKAYRRRLMSPDPAVHGPAALAWCEWDARQGMLDPTAPLPARRADPRFRLDFARLVTHCWSHAGFLDQGAPLARLGTLIHRRLDLRGPPATAWRVHQAWPGSRSRIVEGQGHAGGPEVAEALADLGR